MKAPVRIAMPLLACLLTACGGGGGGSTPSPVAADVRLADLGSQLFSDAGLSSDGSVSCHSCHTGAATAFSDAPNRLSQGVGPIGNLTSRNSPMVSYTAFVPALSVASGDWIGGLFLDGRADSLEGQIEGPLLGAREMANGSRANVIRRLRASTSAAAFLAYFGPGSLPDPDLVTTTAADIDTAFSRLGSALAAHERRAEINPFSARFDAYLQGRVKLTEAEMRGFSLFMRADKGNCAACHPVDNRNAAGRPLFTDFSYDNLGVPAVTGDAPDPGLHATVLARGRDDPALLGKFRVPSLRNVGRTAPYMHNGAFATLEQVVRFYNNRDSDTSLGPTDYPATVNRDELGRLGLSDSEVADIVTFLRTLDDGYVP